ncbi:hypothetical protein [Pseudokineococcus sp. 1T1Z-3]|uniref:hypothetical protein n=1 Tax=Pseudokineococcus sp. 1T1Z-3 TaxID=3132745 RepID=UPI0030A4C863
MRRAVLGALVVTGLGLLTSAGFLVASGVHYRLQEDRGLEPGVAPVLVVGLDVGLLVLGVGVAALVALGVGALLRWPGARTRAADLPRQGSGPQTPPGRPRG